MRVTEFATGRRASRIARTRQSRRARHREVTVTLIKLPSLFGGPDQWARSELVISRFAIFRFIIPIATIILAVVVSTGTWAQSRTIRLVVPFAPAGGTDILARLVAHHISQAHGVTVVVENRPGAGTVIATEAVARAAPDGNTVLIVGNSFVINPNMKKLNYDPLTSFEPICHLTRSPNVVAVHAASPFRTLADLVDGSPR